MTTCPECVYDETQLDIWRNEGGRMPDQTCVKDHGQPCIDCKKKRPHEKMHSLAWKRRKIEPNLTLNPDKRCDVCHNVFTYQTIDFSEKDNVAISDSLTIPVDGG